MEKATVLYDPRNISDVDLVNACAERSVPFSLSKTTREKMINNLFKRKATIKKTAINSDEEDYKQVKCQGLDDLEKTKLKEALVEVLSNKSYLIQAEKTTIRGFLNWEIEFSSSNYNYFIV
jgi:hypothetical protein